MSYEAPSLPSLRGPLASSIIRGEFSKIANEFRRLPATLDGSTRGFQAGQWDNGILNTPTVYRGILGTNDQPCLFVGEYLVITTSVFDSLGSGNTGFLKGTDGRFKMYDGSRVNYFTDSGNNLVVGSGVSENPTNSSTGFFYVPTTNGVATGSPTAYTGAVPMTYDRAANKIGIFTGGVWKWTAALT